MTIPAMQMMLDAMDGIVFLTTPDGEIEAVGTPNWIKFARENQGDVLMHPTAVIGQSLLSFIHGDMVRDVYEQRMVRLLTGEDERAVFPYHCDAPGVSRLMRMTIAPLREKGNVRGLLFQSQPISETVRPPIDLFEPERTRRAFGKDKPPVFLCSFCQRVQPQAQSGWMAAETYYRQGGAADARLSHVVCHDCLADHGMEDEAAMA